MDLPFALPTAVAGIALTAVYAEHGFIGRHLLANGVQVAFARAIESLSSAAASEAPAPPARELLQDALGVSR